MLFGDVLRGLIEDNDLTQKQLAMELHMATSTLNCYVRNLREPDFETLKQLAAYFKVSIDYLLDYHESCGKNAEDELLSVYRQLPPGHQKIFLEQGKVLARLAREQTK